MVRHERQLSEKEVERLLTGPLCSYIRQEEGGWVLRAAEEENRAHVKEANSSNASETPALAAQTRADGMAYQFTPADLDALAFFDAVRDDASTTRIRLNAEHPAYEMLQTALSVGTPERGTEAPRRKLRQAQRTLRLLLVGWARYEENLDGALRQKARRARSDWGRSVRRVVQRHEQWHASLD